MSKKKKNYTIPIVVLIVAILALGAVVYFNDSGEDPYDTPFHIHADFAVYLEDHFKNFSDDRYMSTPANPVSTYLHLHDNNGEVIHFHSEGYDIGDFFSSINMNFNETCLVTDDGRSYCTNETHELVFMVNGTRNEQYGSYVPEDLDRLLIAYVQRGTDLELIMDDVSDKACIQSEKCPERGEPSDESSCTGSSCVIDLTA